MFKGKVALLQIVIFSSFAQGAAAFPGDTFEHPYYLGFKGGMGSTTWGKLVPKGNKQIGAMALSTPIKVDEGGGVLGIYGGYEINPFFAIEAAFTHYPRAILKFDPENSLFTFYHGTDKLITKTETIALSGKFMIPISSTSLRAFSSVGIAGLYRHDMLKHQVLPSASFDVGLDYDITPSVLSEFGFNYTSGNGESEIDPTNDFIPFLYSGYVKLAYRFG